MATLYELDDEQAYEAEISQCVSVTGYHHWFFLSAMAESLNLEFRAFAVDSNGERLGVVPLLFRHRGPVSTVNYLPVGTIGPLLRGEALRAGRMRELVNAVEPVLRGHRVVVTQWAFSPGINISAEQLAMPGFEVSGVENFIIPATKSVDDCLKSMSNGRRYSIKQCTKRGLFMANSSVEEITEWLPEQISGNRERQGVLASYSLTEAQSLTERLAAHPRMLWRSVKAADGQVLGMTVSVISDDRLGMWLLAGSPVPGMSTHSLAYWDLINWCLERGLTLDTGGVPNGGIRRFRDFAGRRCGDLRYRRPNAS